MLLVFSKKLVDYKYSSVQIVFSKEISDRVIDFGKKHISEDNLYTEDIKYGRENEIHCTVKYGLHTNSVEEIKQLVEDFGPFTVAFDKISFFDNEDKPYSVVKIEVKSKELNRLNKMLSELENSDEHPTYNAHCTIAYIKKDCCDDLRNNNEFKGMEFEVTELEFSSSDGNKEKISL